MVYRSSPRGEARERPRDAGIVGEIIDQFSDRFAFFRELVQNSIDAETETIEVELRYDPGLEAMVVSVSDRGEGMTREILENRLLVLFRSTKENDDSKIGKFGVGFASVLAMNPRVVRVTSVRDGQRYVLTVYTDLSYELFDGGRATRNGTEVALEIPMSAKESEDFAMHSWEALLRWCRHASVPIYMTHHGQSGTMRERIDRPLALDESLFEVKARSADGETVVVVGFTEDPAPYAGFFNSGLTLYETDQPLLGRLAFKIQDARLGHTLSRDNVRRDDRFEAAVAFARKVADTRLSTAVALELADLATTGAFGQWRRLFKAALEAQLVLDRREPFLPLVEAIDGRRVASPLEIAKSGGWAATVASPLTEALANDRTPVLAFAGEAHTEEWYAITSLTQTKLRLASTYLTLVSPIEPSSSDLLLLEELGARLDELHRRPQALVLASCTGAHGSTAMLCGRRGTDERRVPAQWITNLSDADKNPFSLLWRAPLVLNVAAPAVVAARKIADHDAAHAASLLSRLVLLYYDKLTMRSSNELLARSLEGLD